MNGNRIEGRDGGEGGRPAWTDTLRPDALTRARLRRAILDAAAPLLHGRRLTWWEVASDWASLLTPAAAAAAIVFAAVALREPTATPAERSYAEATRLEDLVDWDASETLPAALTRDSLADLEVVFAAIHEGP
jgi:hypothetical protein